MSNKRRLLISTSVLVIMIGAIFFAGKPEPSSAQNARFKSYQLIVHCGNPQLPTAMFWHDVKEEAMGLNSICVGNFCPGGAVSLADALGGLPAEVSAALKAKVDKHQADAAAGKGWRLTCLGDDKKPPEDKKPKCEPPSKSPEPPANSTVYPGQFPPTNSTVYPGQFPPQNSTVYRGQFPPTNSTVYPGQFPPPNSTVYDKLHPPDQSECKDCKWELVSYEITCKKVPNLTASVSSGRDIFDGEYKVKATWRCPANGQTKVSEETVIIQQVGCPAPKPTVPTFRP